MSSSSIVGFLAFFQRIVDRRGSLRIEIGGEDLEGRARKYLELLPLPSESLRFKIALRNLTREFDLFAEDAVFVPSVLELQAKVLQLAGANEDAQSIALSQLSGSPVSKLFSVVLSQASEDGFRKVQIDFRIDKESPFRTFYLKEGLEPMEAMTIPKNLALSLKGHTLRVEKAGYKVVRDYMYEGNRMPAEISFEWTEPEVLTLSWQA